MDIKTSLTYKQMRDGMVILGAIRQLSNLSLQLEFPGLTFGQVRITSISDSLNEYMREHMDEVDANDPILKKMFEIGSFVPSKIMKLEESDKGFKVEASINPKDVNSDKRYNSFKKGTLMWSSVQSELDHGYQLSNGMKNCKIFLPSKNIDEGKTYSIGQPLWCVVHKCDENQHSSILRVSAKWEHILKAKQEELDTLHNLLPGMQVEFFIDKITRNGLEGRFLEDYEGYVDQTQLKTPLHTLTKTKEGTLVNAHILYAEPSTNIVHLSLRSLETVPQAKYSVGHIGVAEVLNKSPKGLFVKLGKEEKGFITNNRLLKTLPKQSNLDLGKAINKKYPQGSKHQCRVIDFNHMERMYICTFETEIVKEKLFTSSDLTVGELVTGIVEESKADGLIICAGHIKGFVPNLHISNTKYSDQIKKKFTTGQHVKARVWMINNGSILFTLKQALIESDICLTDVSKAKPNQMYPGVVIQVRESGALVAFYKGIMGWITTRQLGNDQGGHIDPRVFFYNGQVVAFRSLGVKDRRLQLSTKPLSAGRKRKSSEENQDDNLGRKKKRHLENKSNRQLSDQNSDSGISESEHLETTDTETTKASKKNNKNKLKKDADKSDIKNEIAGEKSCEDQVESKKKTKKRKKKQKEPEQTESPDNEPGKYARLRVSSISNDDNPQSDNEGAIDVRKSESSDNSNDEGPNTGENNLMHPIMPGVEDFFAIKKDVEVEEESSSGDEIEDETVQKKKKKLTPAERAELARQEEERIRKIEKELMEIKENPQSASHFDRLVHGEPNSSTLWLQYIAFHISCMEIDKARVVAKRAIESIDVTMIQDKLNAWIAYLQLENMYGTKETFDKVFEDAIQYNDSMEVYLKSIEMLAETGKVSEMEQKIKKARAKFRKFPQMWETIAKAYYLQKNFKEARNCRNMAVKSIEDKKTQLNLIVRFAIMEFRYGEEDAASAIFETILHSDPRKVNIWITYVDQLVKKGMIDIARGVLERSVCQNLPVKSMKTLFMKFRDFEEKHGTPESVEEVKQKAAEYVMAYK